MTILEKSIISVLFGVCLFFAFTLYNRNEVVCVDGDTFAIGKTYYRLAYVDTAEKNQPTSDAAKRFTCNYLKQKDVEFTNIGYDIYGRILTIVSNPQYGTRSLNDRLVDECLAEPFYGYTTDRILKLYEKCK